MGCRPTSNLPGKEINPLGWTHEACVDFAEDSGMPTVQSVPLPSAAKSPTYPSKRDLCEHDEPSGRR